MFGINWIVLAAFASLILLLGVEEIRISGLKTEMAEYVSETEKSARIAAEQSLSEMNRRQSAFDEEAQHARAEKAELEATVVQLADAADGLRGDLANFTQRAKSNACATVRSTGKPGADPLDMLAGVLARADREAAILAEYSDRLRLAGIACERASDAAR